MSKANKAALTITVAILISFANSTLLAAEAPSETHAANVNCPAQTLLPILDTAYHECNNGYVKENGSCEKFVETFKKLLPVFDCQRSFDSRPVPGIWLAGDGALDDYVRLLWRMSVSKGKMFRGPFLQKPVQGAMVLFASAEFRNILDGALAEDYVERSKAIERKLRAKRFAN